MASKTAPARIPKRVEVNQRALVDKVLARYPEEFTVFRELLQNADDARAKKVIIDFQTKAYASHSAEANGKTNGINGTSDIPDLSTTKLFRWVVRNNGDFFEEKDWGRLTKIADGNPDEQKIGAFGVGFYSVFSITDSPLVLSGGKSLSIFFKGDQLYTLDDTCPPSEWTSIEMDLKEDMQVSFPKPFDLARFLAATMTFMSSVENAHVSFDNKVFMKINKSRQVPSPIRVPKDMVPRSKEGTMNIKKLSVVTQEITVELTDWARAVGTKLTSAHRSGTENLPKDPVKRKGFWDIPKREASKVAKVAKVVSRASTYDHRPWWTHSARYAVYSAEVTTSPGEGLRKGLRAMTKKDPPSHFDFEMVYFSKEEQDARAAEEKSDDMGSVFMGPQGLFPQPDGEYMSRIFIGQSTAQTTGIGGHMSGRFIPTVERGSIDLTNGHVAKWNEELLYVGGFLARLVYEQEIRKVWDAWPKDKGSVVPTANASALSSKDKASYAMSCFTFHPSTPDAKVSKILQDAFFDCFNYSFNEHFPVLTNSGIRYTKEVRNSHVDFVPFMKLVPTRLPTSPGDPLSLVDTLPEKYQVREYTFQDVLGELGARTLHEEEMVGCLRWWVNFISGLEDEEDKERTLTFLPSLTGHAKSRIGNSTRVMELRNISKFVDASVWLPWLQSDDALPPDTIPFSFTRPLDRQHISSSLLWQPMTVVDWLSHLISPQIDAAHDIRKNATYSNRVLGVLGNIWPALSSEMKSQAKDLMQDVSWIATNLGFRPPGGAYFPEADVFRDLPVVSVSLFDPQVLTVLSEFGVKRHLDFEELFAKADKLSTWSAMEMIRYINTDPNAMERVEDIRTYPVFPCDKGGKYCITELYLPHEDIRPLGLPILAWSRRIDKDSEDEQLLTEMGFLRHPPLEKLIEIAGNPDPKIQRAAFGYLASKFDELYDMEYDPSKYDDMPFIPAIRDGHECVGAYEEVYSDPSWALMGFQKVHPSVERKIIGRLRMREAPSAKQVIEVFKTSPPKDINMAVKWFTFLGTKQVLSPGDLQEIAKISIVPVEEYTSRGPDSVERTIRMVPPWECFIGGSQYGEEHLYRRLFTFVDFEERANRFLKACGVKAKPDCSDIVNILIKDPKDFLKKACAETDPEKYLVELRGIAVGYEGLAEEDKKKMKSAPIFVGYRTSKSFHPDQPVTVVRDEFQLVPANKVLLADDMENRRIFGEFVWLAPQDELLEKLYESVGSGYLSAHIKYNVKPLNEQPKWPRCEEVRKAILEKLPIFMHEFDEQRLKKGAVHRKWDDTSLFLVKGCKELTVDKRLESNYRISAERQKESNEFIVSAEITTEESGRVVLWLKKTDHLDMYDVAVALCRLLFKTHKKHDVLSLMTILETDKEVLRKRGYDVDRIALAHEAAILEDKKKEEERERLAKKHAEESGEGRYGGNTRIRSRFLDFFRWQSRGPKNAGKVPVGGIVHAIDEIMDQCAKGQASPEEQQIRNREYSGADRKKKDVQYCTELKSTALQIADVNGVAGLIPVWRQITTNLPIPSLELAEFANIVHGLNGVLDLSNNEHGIFNIFWHPEDHDLMGFNRNRLIFLNLAHYTNNLDSGMSPGEAYIHWYYIVLHEIAHNKTPFHDEHHELLVSALSSRFLPHLHSVEQVREYFNCATEAL